MERLHTERSLVETESPAKLELLDSSLGTVHFSISELTQQLEHQANHDLLTGLPNRFFLENHLRAALPRTVAEDGVIALLFIGVDHFKLINDSIDHVAGDQLLREIANRLSACVAAPDVLARLGGDEFAIARTVTANQSNIAGFCQQILGLIAEPFLLNDRKLHVTCSIGVAICPQDAGDPVTLFKYADMALYRAKELGRNNSQLFSSEMNQRTQERVTLRAALHAAIGKQQLFMQYQPVVDLQTGHINGMEALVRWEHPELGLVAPHRFIRIAEESDLIIEIGEWIVRQVCTDIRNWLDRGQGNFRVALKVSPKQFHDAQLADKIAAAMDEKRIASNMLFLEITETVLLQDTLSTVATLESFKRLGLDLVLDDFGTGFSSLNYLKRFSFTKVKIDQSFVKDVADNGDDAAISKAIISMAHSLGILVVAEGVETEAQCMFLSQNLCDEIQGYLFSEPLPPSAICALLQEQRRLPDSFLRLQKPQRTLLLVDDESNIIGALKRLLRGGDFQILTANSGQEGLDLLAQHAVDVIVSDQRMPGMTGVEFLGIAKEKYPDTVRIVLSGYTELHSVTEAVNEGAIYKFLTKPWDDTQLRGHIEEAFRRKEMADENRRLNLEVRTANLDLAQANRRLEELLKQQQQKIIRDEVSLDIVREALRQIPLAVIGVDDESTVVFANDAAQTLFEQTASILGSDANQLIPDLASAPTEGGNKRCTVELGDTLYEVVARSMGHGSHSSGKLMTLTPYKGMP
jgi:diguanylate cyclase (GGDEF)-like protein